MYWLNPLPVSLLGEDKGGRRRVDDAVAPTDRMYTKLRQTFKEYPTIGGASDLRAVTGFTVLYGEKDGDVVAVGGRGSCYCSMIGTCRWWSDRIKKGS